MATLELIVKIFLPLFAQDITDHVSPVYTLSSIEYQRVLVGEVIEDVVVHKHFFS